MASGTIPAPVNIYKKVFSAWPVSLSVGVNNVSNLNVSLSGYTYIGGLITGGSTVGLRNGTTLLGFNVNDHPQVYATSAMEGTLSFTVYYVKDIVSLS